MPYTHKRSYKKNFLAYIGVGAAWNGKPKWDGPCKYGPLPAASPLPARNDSRMTGFRFHKSCWSTKSKYHVEKDDFQFKPLFHFRWFDSYNMRQISQKSTNFLFCSYTLLSPWSCKTLEPFEKQSRTETKSKRNWNKMQAAQSRICWDPPLVLPWRLEGGWKDKAELEPKEPRKAPCSGAPRVVRIHDSLHSSPRRSR